MTNGKLVTIEGIDGSGKGTQVDLLKSAIDATYTKEPVDGSWHEEKIREVLSGDLELGEWGLFSMYLVNHFEHVENVVNPALERGELVISDRYIDSRYVYQSNALSEASDMTREEALDYLQTVHESQSVTPIPDLTIIIDVSVDEALDRISGRGESESWETKKKLTAMRETYHELCQSDDRYMLVSGERSPREVSENVRRALLNNGILLE